MATNYVQPGEKIELTATAAVASGAVVVVSQRVGVAETAAAASGDKYTVSLEGVYNLPALGTDTLSPGDLVYWDAGAGNITATPTGNTLAGIAFESKGSGVTTVAVKLNG